jgi:hypothetical protein
LRNVDLLFVLGGRAAHSLLDLAGHGQEGLLNIGSVLGRGLKEWDTKRVGELLRQPMSTCVLARKEATNLCYRVLDNLLVRHIGLVAYQELVDAFGGISVNLLQPLLDVVE